MGAAPHPGDGAAGEQNVDLALRQVVPHFDAPFASAVSETGSKAIDFMPGTLLQRDSPVTPPATISSVDTLSPTLSSTGSASSSPIGSKSGKFA